MRSLLSLFRPSKTEVAIQADISRGGEKPKPSTVVFPPTRSTAPKTSASTVGGGEVETLRASVVDLDHKLQAVTSERDALRSEFSDYREATQADQRDLEKENQRIHSQLRETGQMLSEQIASTGQPGPIPGFHRDDDSPQARTDKAFLSIARQIKNESTGDNRRIERP